MSLLPTKLLFQENYFGLSLTHSAIRALAISSDKRIKSSAEISLPANVFTHQITDKRQLSQALHQLLSMGNFVSQYAAVCIPEYHSFTRSHSIPRIPLDEVKEALTWQIEKIFPLPKEEIYFDWKLLSSSDAQLNLLVVAMHRKTVDELIASFEAVGIKPISFEPSASALTRILNLNNNQPTILVEINPTGSSATLIENNVSTLTITNQFEQNNVEQDVKNALQKTSQSIQSLIVFHANRRAGEETPVNILLTGDSASEELSKWLSSYLNRPVALLQINGVPSHFQQAYAAANTSVNPSGSGLSVNLLPDDLTELYSATRVQQKIITRTKFAFLTSLVTSGLILGVYGDILRQVSKSQTQLKQLEFQNSQYTYNAQEVTTINKTSAAVITLFPKKNTPIEAYKQIFRVIPANIKLNSVTYDGAKQKLTLSGSAGNRDALLQFKNTLESSPHFNNVNLPLGSLEKPYDIEFTLALSVVKPKT